MKKPNLKKITDNVTKLLYKLYKKEIKKDEFLKEKMKEFKHHFKKNGWALDYFMYLNETKLQNDSMKFNVLLDLIGLEPYCKKNEFLIKIRKKKHKRSKS